MNANENHGVMGVIHLRRPQKNQVFDPLPPVHMRPHGPDPPPLVDATRGRHEIHTALLKWLVQ